MAGATIVQLSVGDPPSADSLLLTDDVNYTLLRGAAAGVLSAQSQGGPDWGTAEASGPSDAGQPPGTRRMQLPLLVRCPILTPDAGARDWISENARAIERKLDQARQAWGAYGVGTRVTLSIQRPGHSNPILFDVAGGMLTYRYAGLLTTGPVDLYVLVLYTTPMGRGPQTTATVSGTITNATSPPYYVPGVAGDRDAITRVIVRDVSPTGIIQKLRLGLRALRPMAAGDFTAIYSAAVSAAPGNIGTLTAMAGTRNGVNAVRATPATAFAPMAQVQSAGGPLDYGVCDVLAKVRDGSATLGPPFGVGLLARPTGGTLPYNLVVYVQVTELDAAGHETVGSPQGYATIPIPGTTTGSVSVSWSPNGAPATYRVYWLLTGGSWGYATVTAPTTTYTITAAPGVAGTPTASPATVPAAQLQAFAMVAGTQQNLSSVPGRVASCQLSNNDWEALVLGTLRLPPLVHPEATAELPWLLQIQAASASGATLDVDCVWLFPHDYAGPYVEVTAPGGALTQRCDWYLDTRYDGRPSARVYAAGTNTLVGQVDMPNGFRLRPGDNLLIVEADQYASGAFQPLVASQFTVQVTYAPCYSFDRGTT